MPQLTIQLDDRTYGHLLGLSTHMGLPPEEAAAQSITLVVNHFLLGFGLIGRVAAAAAEVERQFQKRMQQRGDQV